RGRRQRLIFQEPHRHESAIRIVYEVVDRAYRDARRDECVIISLDLLEIGIVHTLGCRVAIMNETEIRPSEDHFGKIIDSARVRDLESRGYTYVRLLRGVRGDPG